MYICIPIYRGLIRYTGLCWVCKDTLNIENWDGFHPPKAQINNNHINGEMVKVGMPVTVTFTVPTLSGSSFNAMLVRL
jgi:hypothetical protein